MILLFAKGSTKCIIFLNLFSLFFENILPKWQNFSYRVGPLSLWRNKKVLESFFGKFQTDLRPENLYGIYYLTWRFQRGQGGLSNGDFPGVGNISQNPRDPGYSRDFRDWEYQFGTGIWDLFLKSGIRDSFYKFRILGLGLEGVYLRFYTIFIQTLPCLFPKSHFLLSTRSVWNFQLFWQK